MIHRVSFHVGKLACHQANYNNFNYMDQINDHNHFMAMCFVIP